MLQLIALNGDIQGQNIRLVEGLKIGGTDECNIKIESDSIGSNIFIIECNNSGLFAIYSENRKSLLSNGTENLPRLELVPGMIFSIGDLGFSVQEAEDSVDNNSAEAQENISLSEAFQTLEPDSPPPLSIPTQSIRFRFVRGLWINRKWDIPWLPMSFGTQSNLFFFQDTGIPSKLDFLRLSHDLDQSLALESDIANFVKINGTPMSSPHTVSHGDLVEFAQTAFYIELK